LPTVEQVLSQHPEFASTAARLPVTELATWLAEEPGLQLVDVRNGGELSAGTLPGARHIPLAALVERMGELDPAAPTVVYCASGYRSSIAASALRASGVTVVADLLGGFNAWSASGLPVGEVSHP
ncbi:MAG TPA: rhodanese-like domain-containing protein, partial [Pseudonocardiaceae bacterium]|nr:rhodanese-like domain-containing protein [Pseudonocardiaceae bacterium]